MGSSNSGSDDNEVKREAARAVAMGEASRDFRPVPGLSGLALVGWDAAGPILALAELDSPGDQKPDSNPEAET